MSERDRKPLDEPEFWNASYLQETPPWDAGGPAPPLQRLLETQFFDEPLRIAFVGVGTGNDAIPYARAGHEVVGFDFAPRAVEIATKRAEEAGVADRCRFEERDIFTLGSAYPEAFDRIIEYTCFCAIHPSRRRAYAQAVWNALVPGGLLVGLFYPDVDDREEEGPPFPVRRHHVASVFCEDGPGFRIVHEEKPEDSIERRQGKERLCILEKVADRREQD